MVDHIIDREEEDVKFYTFSHQFLTRCFWNSMQTIAVKMFQLKQLKKRNLKNQA